MIIHTLDNQKHKDFLAQNRIDPITGDLLQENDKIVICSACKSAFLVDSWEYMDRKHCEQRLTLKEIPINEIVKIERFNLIDLEKIKVVSRYIAALNSATPYFLASGTFCLILHYLSIISESFYAMQITSWSYMISAFAFYVKSPYKYNLKIKNNTFFFDKKSSSKNSLKAENIKDVEIYKSKNHKFTNLIRGLYKKKQFVYTLKITDKNQQEYSFLLEHKELERIKSKTNLLQRFNNNSLPFLSVNSKVKEITK